MSQLEPDRTSQISQNISRAELRKSTVRRRAVRAFAIFFIAAMVIDSAPQSWRWLSGPKRAISALFNRVGLWQGEWSMFAPDPVINNGWFTAEIQNADGTSSQWNSPYWVEITNRDKFLQFRYLNYFNRLPSPWFQLAREDFADYLARKSRAPVESVRLFHTRMQLIMPEDGSLPKRDEAQWMFTSQPVVHRRYSQPQSQPPSDQP
jgi:hypothetical protein